MFTEAQLLLFAIIIHIGDNVVMVGNTVIYITDFNHRYIY